MAGAASGRPGKSERVSIHTYGGRKFKLGFDKIREAAGVKGLWSKSQRSIMRHTLLCSMHWAHYKV